jgi:hypothetical protein
VGGIKNMKNWITRFGMLAVLGSLVCGLVVAGCGGAPEEEAAPNAAAPGTPPAAPAAPAEDGS